MKPDDAARAVGKRIRQLRKQGRLTIEGLGAAAGLDPNYLGQVERGRQTPSITTLAKIAAALGVGLTTVVDLHADASSKALQRAVSKRIAKMTADELRVVQRLLDALRA